MCFLSPMSSRQYIRITSKLDRRAKWSRPVLSRVEVYLTANGAVGSGDFDGETQTGVSTS
jgi:hypothetical protein